MNRKNMPPKALAFAAGVVGTLALGSGCLDRPTVSESPTLKSNFTSSVKQQSVDKLDILFMIDNSESMGDKQAILSAAVPGLVTRLVNPNCLDSTGTIQGVSTKGSCASFPNTQIEFPPVHDMHVGVVSSSIGASGSDECDPTAKNPTNMALNSHEDDQAHLLNRSGANETAIPDEGTGNFLAWLPSTAANAGKPAPPDGVVALGGANADSSVFIPDFTNLITGVHEFGCGFEAQLESWYRFLIQPDPYASISPGVSNGTKVSSFVGVDQVILQQRADFLRPDSLLAIIDVSDETEDYLDPMMLGGQAWRYDNSVYPSAPGPIGWGAPMATPSCATNPFDDNCTSCELAGGQGCANPYYYTSTQDPLNVRQFHMKQRFGVDLQFPVQRYIRGLTLKGVPNTAGEHFQGSTSYTGEDHADPKQDGCVNPIFATGLPTDPTGELCQLTPGPRDPSLVYFAFIGGVPHQLLQVDPTNPDSPQKDTLVDADWVKILGQDPLNYKFDGADPHMIESITPRANINANDPINGGDFMNGGGDMQYACIFDITPKDCSLPQYAPACDCEGSYAGPLCASTAGTTPLPSQCSSAASCQVKAKAYPGIRELAVVKALSQGQTDQGIVSSLCPIHTTDMMKGNDPLYGYRPAVNAIVNRLKKSLANQCLPHPLAPNPDGSVNCLVLETLPTTDPGCPDGSTCEAACAPSGTSPFFVPEPSVLSTFRAQQKLAGNDTSQHPVCAVTQILNDGLVNGSCTTSSQAGWCYVTGAAAGVCAQGQQAVLFSPGGNPTVGASVNLQCIETSTAGSDAAVAPTTTD